MEPQGTVGSHIGNHRGPHWKTLETAGNHIGRCAMQFPAVPSGSYVFSCMYNHREPHGTALGGVSCGSL